MNLYTYKPSGDYFEFVAKVQAQRDPISGVSLTRPNAVEFWPTVKAGENQAVVLNADKTAWVLVDDFRGVTYWNADGQPHTISELGQPIPDGASLTEPETGENDAVTTA